MSEERYFCNIFTQKSSALPGGPFAGLLFLWQLKAPGLLGEGCQASYQPSNTSSPQRLAHLTGLLFKFLRQMLLNVQKLNNNLTTKCFLWTLSTVGWNFLSNRLSFTEKQTGLTAFKSMFTWVSWHQKRTPFTEHVRIVLTDDVFV